MKTYEIQNCFRSGANTRLCIGISESNLKKYKYFSCGFKGSASWDKPLRITIDFARKYPKKKYKMKKKNITFEVFVIPIDDIKEYNYKFHEKLKSYKNANITSPYYTQDQITVILNEQPVIREIAEFFGGLQMTPYENENKTETDRKT